MNTLSSLLNFIGGKIPYIGTIELSRSNVSAFPVTFTDTLITDKHVFEFGSLELSSESAFSNDWTVTTSNGQAVLSGTLNNATDIKFRLEAKIN